MLTLSVVIPTRNKASFLKLTLNSLFHQSLDRSIFEVVIVDDGSTDATAAVIDQYQQEDWHLLALREEPSGRSIARNKGILASSGQILVFLDDDSICHEHFLLQHLSEHSINDSSHAVVGGRREATILHPSEGSRRVPHSEAGNIGQSDESPAYRDRCTQQEHIVSSLASYSHEAFNAAIADLQATSDPLPAERTRHLARIARRDFTCPWALFMNANASASRDAIIEVGLFDEGFKGWGEEDREMGYRLFKHGCQFGATRDAVVFHQPHLRDIRTDNQSWWINYSYFGRKHPYPEIFLRWRLVWSFMTMTEYECKVSEIVGGKMLDHDIRRLRTEFRALSTLISRGLDPMDFVRPS